MYILTFNFGHYTGFFTSYDVNNNNPLHTITKPMAKLFHTYAQAADYAWHHNMKDWVIKKYNS